MNSRKECPMRHTNGNCLVIGGFCTSVNDEICSGLRNAYAWGALREKRRNTWVSVKDGLPEDKSVQGNAGMVQVLCFFKFGDIRMCYYGKDHWQDEPHFNWGGGVVDEYVTHWQYMPEPPKEVSE